MPDNNQLSNQTTAPLTIKQYLAAPEVQKRVKEMLDDRASDFITSVISISGNDAKLSKCEPRSLFNACLTAASMHLPISKELAMAYIIPYENNVVHITEAQIQLGWRAYVQLAQRSGEYKSIAATEVYEGQLISRDPLRGNVYDFTDEEFPREDGSWAKKSDRVIGYAAMFTLLSGFEKDVYMSTEKTTEHAKKYSKAYQYDLRKGYKSSPWSTDFDAMGKKTVLKKLIKDFGPMSIDMQKAVKADQAVVKEDGEFKYVDGETIDPEAKAEERRLRIAAAEVKRQEMDKADFVPKTVKTEE